MEISILQYIGSMGIYIILLMLMVEFMRKNYKIAVIFWLLSLLTFPFWFEQLDGWFRWVKTISVLLPTAIIVGFSRVSYIKNSTNWLKAFRGNWVLWSLYGILGLNILEASIKDIAMGNYFNAISGFILIATIPLVKSRKNKKAGWKIESKRPGDLIVYTDSMWNLLYTTWNIAFVFSENPGYAASSFCILLAAELYPIIKKRPELYVIARVYTLAMHLLIRGIYDVFTPIMDSSSFANDTVVYYWGLINLALSIPYFFWFFFRKQNTVLEEVKSE